MKTGTLQRRWQEKMPAVYDKQTRIVCMDIVAERQTDEDGNEKEGYSFVQVEIDRLLEYGHIKSQLIEAGYAQKDEFGLIMNAVGDIIDAALSADSWEAFKESLSTVDIREMQEFTAYRAMCAQAAKAVMQSVNE